MNVLANTYYIFLRHVKAQLRMPIFLIFTLVQPLLWLILFGQLFSNIINPLTAAQFGTTSYLTFFAPGIILQTVLFGTAWSGTGIITDMDLGILDKMLVTPVSRVAIVLGRVFANVLTLVIQSGIILLVAIIFMGLRPATGLWGVIGTLVIAILFGLGFSGLSNAIAIVARRQETLVTVTTFTTMPLMFLSSALLPAALMPDWIQTAIKFNPFNYAVLAIRDLFLHSFSDFTADQWADLYKALLITAGIAIVTCTWATVMFRRRVA